MIATPVGLIIASGFGLASVSRLAGPRADLVQRYRRTILAALVLLMVLWAVASLAGLGPLGAVSATNDPPMLMEGMPGMDGMPPVQSMPSMEEAGGPLAVLATVAIAAYAIAAWRYLAIHRKRGGILPLAIGSAFVLLAEATVAVVLSHNWESTWWAWHLLILVAFATIALGVRDEYRRSRSLATAYGGVYSDATLARIDRWHPTPSRVLPGLARGASRRTTFSILRREGATEEEIGLLTAAAHELTRLDDLFRPAPGLRWRSAPARRQRRSAGWRIVSVLFALRGLHRVQRGAQTSRGHRRTRWAAVVPVIEGAGRAGLLRGRRRAAVFNASGGVPTAERAGAGAVIVERARDVARANPGWPMFRVGVNTGPAVVGNVGVEGRRSPA